MLPEVPASPTADGEPAFGTYTGRCGDTRLALGERGVSRFRRYVSEKRWQWFAAFDEDLAVGGAIVDGGFFGNAFLWVYDRETGEFLLDADTVVPSPFVRVTTHPTAGHVAGLDLPRSRLGISRTHETLTIDGQFAGADLSLSAETGDSAAITAICPVPARQAGINVTQKEPAVPVSGQLSVRGTEYSIDGSGFLDYSHGLLGRETHWEWAFASGRATDGTPVAFNLVDQFNEGMENVVWVDGHPEAVGAASLTKGEDWQVTTDCGTVDATLAVEDNRRQDINVGLVRSAYNQPLGRWRGSVAGYESEGVGVAEDHLTRW